MAGPGRRAATAVAAALVLAGAGCGGGGGGGEAEEDTGDPRPAACVGDLVLVASANGEWEETGDVVGLTADGEVRRLTTDGAAFGPSVSPDATQVVFAGIGDDGEVSDSFGPFNTDLYVVGADGQGRRRLLDGQDDRQPAWSPDGASIAFVRGGDPNTGEPADRIHVVAADGTGDRELVVADDEALDDAHPAWSPDGEHLAFVRYRAPSVSSRPSEVVVVAADGSEPRVVHESDEWVGRPTWSPDGARLAFPAGTTSQAGVLTVLDLDSGATTTGEAAVDGLSWAPNGLLYGLAQPPALTAFGGSWRVAEVAVADGSVGPARPVPGVAPVHFAYTDFRVEVPACLAPDAAALTSEADEVEPLTITHPGTGEPVEVLPRSALPALVRQNVSDPPEGYADDARSVLVYGDAATNEALAGVGRRAESATGEPAATGPPPLQVPDGELTWLVEVDGRVSLVEATTGRIVGSATADEGLPDLPDLADG